MWIEGRDKCVAENEQRNYGNEEVNRDHQRKVLALYLAEPADGSSEEADAWPLLEVCPELLSTGDPPARSAAPLIRSGRRVLPGDCAGLRGRLDRFVQRHIPRTRVRPTSVGVAERTCSGSQASMPGNGPVEHSRSWTSVRRDTGNTVTLAYSESNAYWVMPDRSAEPGWAALPAPRRARRDRRRAHARCRRSRPPARHRAADRPHTPSTR